MDIALINSWPNLAHSAGSAFIERFKRAADKLGHRAFAAVTSDEVEAGNPDFAIALDEISPKLTAVPTFGVMWTPPLRYHREARRMRSILSHDGWLVGSGPIRTYLEDLEFSLGVEKPKSDFLFLPTASFEDRPDFRRPRQGLGFDVPGGGDHPDREFVAALEAAGLLASPGQEAGAALCLHTDEERTADVPSARLFEAAAGGAVIVTDELPFARRVLGDAALYVDPQADRAAAVEQVRRHLAWLDEDPARGERLAAAAHAALRRFGLEAMVERCCAFGQTVIAEARQARLRAVAALQTPSPGRPLVDVIVRAGGRPPEVVGRALGAIARQDGGSYRAIVVDYKGSEEIRAFAEGFRAPNLAVTYVRSPDTGFRSTSLWTGLAEVEAPFFAILDDDDTVAPDHFPSLIELAARYPGIGLFHGGTVRAEDDGAVPPPPNFAGPLGLEFRERRELRFLEPYDPARLAAFDNHITSNAFVARRELLDRAVLADPALEVSEDVYLLLLLAARTDFQGSFRPTAFWHWRSVRDNSMTAVTGDAWRRAAARIAHRLAHLTLPAKTPLFRLRDDAPFILRLGVPTDFGPDMVARCEGGALSLGEPEGVWTSATRAFVRLLLSDFVEHARIVLEFVGAKAPGGVPQTVRISIDGEPLYAGPAPAWERIRVERHVRFARARNVVVLRAECEVTFNPLRAGESGDRRDLGVRLSRIVIEKADPQTIEQAEPKIEYPEPRIAPPEPPKATRAAGWTRGIVQFLGARRS